MIMKYIPKKTKKISLILLMVLISIYISISISLPTAVNAYEYHYMETLGEVISLEDGFLLVSGIGLTEDAFDEVLLYISEAEVYDLQTGFAISPSDIYEGDCIRAVYEPCGQAIEIYINVGEPRSADFMVVVSDNIWYSDDGCSFVTLDGKYRITLTEETRLYDSYGYEMSFEEITPGMEMFVWAAIVTASFPGQVIPDKIVLLS